MIHIDRQRPLHCDFVPLTKRERNLSAKRRDRRQENAQGAEKFNPVMQEGASYANLRLEPEKHNLTADQSFTEKDDRVHQGVNKLIGREDYVSEKLKAKTKKEQMNNKNTGSERERNPKPEIVERTKTIIVFDRDTDGQEQRLAEYQELRGRRAIAETGF